MKNKARVFITYITLVGVILCFAKCGKNESSGTTFTGKAAASKF